MSSGFANSSNESWPPAGRLLSAAKQGAESLKRRERSLLRCTVPVIMLDHVLARLHRRGGENPVRSTWRGCRQVTCHIFAADAPCSSSNAPSGLQLCLLDVKSSAQCLVGQVCSCDVYGVKEFLRALARMPRWQPGISASAKEACGPTLDVPVSAS